MKNKSNEEEEEEDKRREEKKKEKERDNLTMRVLEYYIIKKTIIIRIHHIMCMGVVGCA